MSVLSFYYCVSGQIGLLNYRYRYYCYFLLLLLFIVFIILWIKSILSRYRFFL